MISAQGAGVRLFQVTAKTPRSAASSLPGNISALMGRVGRYQIGLLGPAGVTKAPDEGDEVATAAAAALWPFAEAGPAAFVAALAETVTPSGGWAAYGAAHTALDLVADPDRNSPAYRALMDAPPKPSI